MGSYPYRLRRTAARLADLTDSWCARVLPHRRIDFERIFNSIYSNSHWGPNADGRGSSGPGSTVETTAKYRRFIESLIRDEQVRTVVDAGCGDWTFSRHIDWQGASYTGFDASSLVVKQLTESYAGPNIAFRSGDITAELPTADLLIVKDVLQHLPNRCVQQFICTNLLPGRYRLAVITNDQGREGRNNRDIRAGGFRLLDLTRKPFSLAPTEQHHLFDDSTPEKIVQVWRAPVRREP